MLDRAFWRFLCVIAALILAGCWLFSVAVSGFAAPAWVPPSSVVALAIAVIL